MKKSEDEIETEMEMQMETRGELRLIRLGIGLTLTLTFTLTLRLGGWDREAVTVRTRVGGDEPLPFLSPLFPSPCIVRRKDDIGFNVG
jgi:hypothetical protein